MEEVDRIARSTEFNGIHLLDGSRSSVKFVVGTNLASISPALSATLATSLGLDSLNVGSSGNTSTAIAAIDVAIDSVSSSRGRLGAMQNHLGYAINNLANLAAAESRIRDVDIALETALLVTDQILQQATIAILAQANQMPGLALQLIQGAGR